MSRCLIYKVHTVRFTFHRVAAGFKFITSFRLCQELFSSFLTFSSSLIRRPGAVTAALAGDSDRLPHLVPLVKNFFQVFSTFLKLFLWRTPMESGVSGAVLSPAARRSLILANAGTVVNTFFSFFSSFFSFSPFAFNYSHSSVCHGHYSA